MSEATIGMQHISQGISGALMPMPRETLAPRTFTEAIKFAEYLAGSELVPVAYQKKPANIVVAMQYGMELGLPVLQALQSVAVINGRPTMWGDAMLALVMSHPDYVTHSEYCTGEGDAMQGVFEIQRRGHKPHTQTFSVSDARAAGLLDKQGPWKQYRGRMLKLRARGFALRDKFPDALRGVISREEAEDYQMIEGGEFAQATTTSAIAPPAVDSVTKDQARAFGQAYKASGYSAAEAQAWCRENLGVESTLKIPADRLGEAMRWASTVKTFGPSTSNDAAKVAVFLPTRDEQIAREAAGILGWSDEKLATELLGLPGGWIELVGVLNAEMDKGLE